MPTTRDYQSKRNEYMHKARVCRCQIVMMDPKHRPTLRRLISRYVGMARTMNHKAIQSRRVDDEREFERQMKRA